jgi:hypothetical protein
MGNFGFQELLVLLVFFGGLGLPIIFYYLGKRSGYKQWQLDVYRKINEERKEK